MNGIQIKHNLDRLAAGARADAAAFPQGVAQGLTWTMAKVRRAEIDNMRRVFDRPTRWTLNAVEYKPARPDKLEALVWLKDDYTGGIAPANYLEPQIIGGSRRIKRFERLLQQRRLMPPGWFAIPGNGARLDRFGNMRGSQIVEILSALQAFNLSGFSANRTTRSMKRNKRLRKYFAITGNNRRASNGGNLPMGIYEQERDKSIVTVLRFRPTVHYERRLHWFAIADEVMSKHKDADIRGGIRKALRQARGHAALAA
jgi:hypothetical protein